MPFYIVYQTENTRNNGHNFGGGGGGGGGEGWGAQERSPTGGRRDREVAGVANLGRSPDQSPGGEAYIP